MKKMKKMKTGMVFFGLIAVLLTFGLILTVCDNGSGGGGTPLVNGTDDKKTDTTKRLVVTNIPVGGFAIALLVPIDDDDSDKLLNSYVTGGPAFAYHGENTLTVELKKRALPINADPDASFDGDDLANIFTNTDWDGTGEYYIFLTLLEQGTYMSTTRYDFSAATRTVEFNEGNFTCRDKSGSSS
ncbi:MAG: hypothetical protein LBV68_08490 [Spirochaetaceae bacterium]|jgi:hypothetical protein|nr:hypothetical protein [Spirochaetaceae bacterium]